METARRGVTDAQVEEARRRASAGESLRVIARDLDASASTLNRRLNPEYAERQRKKSRDWKKSQTGVCERCCGITKYNGRRKTQLCTSCQRADLAKAMTATRGHGVTVRRILRTLADGTERSYSEIRDGAGLSDSTMSNRLYQRLLPYGFVQRVGHGRYAITDAGQAVLTEGGDE